LALAGGYATPLGAPTEREAPGERNVAMSHFVTMATLGLARQNSDIVVAAWVVGVLIVVALVAAAGLAIWLLIDQRKWRRLGDVPDYLIREVDEDSDEPNND
jgi:hypothetical protein